MELWQLVNGTGCSVVPPSMPAQYRDEPIRAKRRSAGQTGNLRL